MDLFWGYEFLLNFVFKIHSVLWICCSFQFKNLTHIDEISIWSEKHSTACHKFIAVTLANGSKWSVCLYLRLGKSPGRKNVIDFRELHGNVNIYILPSTILSVSFSHRQGQKITKANRKIIIVIIWLSCFASFSRQYSGASSTIRIFLPLLNFGIIAPTHHDSDTLIGHKTNKQASGSSERVACFFVNCLAQNGWKLCLFYARLRSTNQHLLQGQNAYFSAPRIHSAFCGDQAAIVAFVMPSVKYLVCCLF